jgi:serine/threonine protein kinase
MGSLGAIGRYQLQGLIGSGAMGEVYEAYDPAIERRIAVKVLRRELVSRGDDGVGWLERFRQEARAAGRLLHPHIVTVLDYGEDGGTPFLAMEFVEGEAVDAVLKRQGRLGEQDALSVIMQVLSALEFAHANGVVHRDIKPGNILLTKSGLVKITDFGIARLESSDLTLAGDILGTPSYMSPEQLAGKPADCRADLFAVGAVLFELLTGARPFGRRLGEVVVNMERRGPADIRALNPDINPALKPVVEVALALNPDRRYASAAEFSRAITEAQAKSPSNPAELAYPAELARALPSGGEETVRSPLVVSQPSEAAGTAQEASLGTELLTAVERDLAAVIGPLARVVVRRSAKTVRSLGELYQAVSSYIEDERDRGRFLQNGEARIRILRSQSGTPQSGPGQTETFAPSSELLAKIDPEVLRRLELALTRCIGPIARILIRQQLRKSNSLSQLYRDLAAHIPNEGDRATFLASEHGR